MYAAEMAGPIHLESDLEALVRAYAPKGDSWSHELALQVLDSDRPMWPRTEFDPGTSLLPPSSYPPTVTRYSSSITRSSANGFSPAATST
jgi:hypothetical protein